MPTKTKSNMSNNAQYHTGPLTPLILLTLSTITFFHSSFSPSNNPFVIATKHASTRTIYTTVGTPNLNNRCLTICVGVFLPKALVVAVKCPEIQKNDAMKNVWLTALKSVIGSEMGGWWRERQ